MGINVYQKGDLVRITGVFRDITGALVDPTTVSWKATKPSGTPVTHTYNPGSIVRDSLGNFHLDVSADEAGTWLYRWENTGTGQAAEDGEFFVSAPGA
jgi:uncharacterized protein YfaS (alpha-2-macroglobulin family)